MAEFDNSFDELTDSSLEELRQSNSSMKRVDGFAKDILRELSPLHHPKSLGLIFPRKALLQPVNCKPVRVEETDSSWITLDDDDEEDAPALPEEIAQYRLNSTLASASRAKPIADLPSWDSISTILNESSPIPVTPVQNRTWKLLTPTPIAVALRTPIKTAKWRRVDRNEPLPCKNLFQAGIVPDDEFDMEEFQSIDVSEDEDGGQCGSADEVDEMSTSLLISSTPLKDCPMAGSNNPSIHMTLSPIDAMECGDELWVANMSRMVNSGECHVETFSDIEELEQAAAILNEGFYPDNNAGSSGEASL